MTLDEAIIHAEEVAKEQDKLCKRHDDASGYTRSGNEKIRTNEAKKCAVCAEEHRMLAWWLRDYKRLKEKEPSGDCISRQAVLDEAFEVDTKEYGRIEVVGVDAIDALPSVKPQTWHCKNCKYFEYDSVAKVDGIPLIVAHEICSKWGDGCKTREDGYCFLFEPKMSENPTGSEEGEDDETAD